MKNGIEIDAYGNKFYYLNDLLHREDGPAFEDTGVTKTWWQHDKRHRSDGPAIEWAHGYKEWWFHGKQIKCNSQNEFEAEITKLIFS
jgi:hypothetical protein